MAASSSQSGSVSVPAAALEPFRDVSGLLPLVPCSKCGTQMYGRVSQKKGSKGKRFYKCPLLEHTEFACGVYMFEEEYVEYLVLRGVLPQGCSRLKNQEVVGSVAVKNAPVEALKAAIDAVEEQAGLLQSGVMHLRDAEGRLKDVADRQVQLLNRMDMIGERLLLIGLGNLLVVVLILLVLLFK